MMDLDHLLAVADAYKGATGLSKDETVSSRAFGDSKKLAALRDGADITVGRFNATIRWFAENWPDGAEWPSGVDRPSAPERAAS